MIDGAEKSALQMGKFLKQAIAKSLELLHLFSIFKLKSNSN
jgi:hypothetical protein